MPLSVPARPLLLLTRPEPASLAFLHGLEDDLPEFDTVIAPLIGIATTGPLPEIPRDATLIFTSANAVRAYADLGGPPGRDAYTVGSATGEAARAAGLTPRVADGDVAALAARIVADRPGGPLLHLRGRHAAGDLRAALAEAGFEADEAILYDQPRLPPTAEARAALDGTRPVVAPLFSPRTAAALAETAPIRAPLLVAAMSARISEAIRPAVPYRTRIAERPDAASMGALTALLLAEAVALEGQKGAE